MRHIPLACAIAGALGACGDGPAGAASDASDAPRDTAPEIVEPPPLALAEVDPAIVDPRGGSRLRLTGEGFARGAIAVELAGVGAAAIEVVSDGELRVIAPPIAPGDDLDVTVVRGAERVTLSGAVAAWSPDLLAGARLFDAAHGATLSGPGIHYEWQRLTPDMGASWRVRDGNTTTWLPSTGRFWMVGGWNGMREPDGFSSVPEGTGSPQENTTNEVWSSADAVTWTLELPHGHGQFERRHVHNTVVWRGRLWMVGGDHHQGRYNHDVVTSADGVTWDVVLGPGAAAEPPWSERGMPIVGVHDDHLWLVGGQDMVGDPATYVYHNDVWRSDDGVTWTEVAPDGPASDTRWAGCSAADGLVSFRGRLWLVGCARERPDAVGHAMLAEVWSTADGLVWRRHADPPWAGKIWHNVVVWDDLVWTLFGFTYGDPGNGWPTGNATEAWYSADGEAWRSTHPDAPVPGSHAQGVAVTDEALVLAGGNYTFGVGAGVDKSVWRLVPFRGDAVSRWTDRGGDGLVVAADEEGQRPVRVPDAFGPGAPGLHFDGSTSWLALAPGEVDAQPAGRSILWVARAPWVPLAPGWVETFNPAGTIVGGAYVDGFPLASVGLTAGRPTLVNREQGFDADGLPLWKTVTAGVDLQRDVGHVHLAGVTHSTDGEVRVWADGEEVARGTAHYGVERAWTRIGAGLDGGGEGPANRFAGTLGAVLVLPFAADDVTLARVHAWSRGRFGAPARAPRAR